MTGYARQQERIRLEMLTSLRRGFGFDRAPIATFSSDLEFVEHYGLRVGLSRPDFVGYKHMIEPYEDSHTDQVLMAAAQTGKSARIMVRILRAAFEHWGALFGYYFPDFALPAKFSSDIFKPFVLSSSELAPWLGHDGDGEKGTDQILTRTIGATKLYFLSVRGKTATEGLPLKGVFFDEVRRMSYGDIQRVEERTSAQTNPLNFKVSTAFWDNSDIHAAFLKGDQRYFHTFCACPEGVVLSLTFPDCVADLTRATPKFRREVEHAYRNLPWLGMTPEGIQQYGEAVFICPKCGTIITDPRDGWWEPHNPGAWVHSYQMPQMLTPSYNAARIWKKYDRPGESTDIREVWNSMLGLPYADKEQQPVQPEHLLACVTSEARWSVHMRMDWRKRNIKNTAMGIDAMGGFNCVVIKEMAPNGKYRTIHLEVCHGDDPWRQCAVLMEEFDVRICVADCNPHWNEAHRFAKAFEGRVWLCSYADTGPVGDMISWKDRRKAPAGQQKAGDDVKFKYSVLVSRTRALQWSLKRWEQRRNEMPDPKKLMQRLPKQAGKVVLTAGLRSGQWEPTPISQDVYFIHLQSVVFVKRQVSEEKEREGVVRMVAEHIRLDPHFAHADLYANVALARIGKGRGAGIDDA